MIPGLIPVSGPGIQIEGTCGIRIVLAGSPPPALCAVVSDRFRHQG
jgi:hypothetical protein